MYLIKPSFGILTEIDREAMLRRIEEAGRTCYKSEDKITANSASSFVKKIIKLGHESVLEHESISVRFIVDRGVSHELVRHRLAAFSQESTRYCNYKGGVTFIIPPWVDIPEGNYSEFKQNIKGAQKIWFYTCLQSEIDYTDLINAGWSPQQARSVLPNSLKTEIVMTANLREWRHVLKLRTSKAAHPQMREVMNPLLAELTEKIPEIFGDLLKEK